MPNAEGRPIVLVITNIPAWTYFRKELGDGVDIRASHSDPYEAWNDALSDGCRPDIIAIGCVANGSHRAKPFYADFIENVRQPEPVGPGFTGPILGLCEFCWSVHIKAGCDEVSQFGPNAARRILEIVEENGIGRS